MLTKAKIIHFIYNLLHDITVRKMFHKATWGKKRMELLHNMMKGRDYGELKDLISD